MMSKNMDMVHKCFINWARKIFLDKIWPIFLVSGEDCAKKLLLQPTLQEWFLQPTLPTSWASFENFLAYRFQEAKDVAEIESKLGLGKLSW